MLLKRIRSKFRIHRERVRYKHIVVVSFGLRASVSPPPHVIDRRAAAEVGVGTVGRTPQSRGAGLAGPISPGPSIFPAESSSRTVRRSPRMSRSRECAAGSPERSGTPIPMGASIFDGATAIWSSPMLPTPALVLVEIPARADSVVSIRRRRERPGDRSIREPHDELRIAGERGGVYLRHDQTVQSPDCRYSGCWNDRPPSRRGYRRIVHPRHIDDGSQRCDESLEHGLQSLLKNTASAGARFC